MDLNNKSNEYSNCKAIKNRSLINKTEFFKIKAKQCPLFLNFNEKMVIELPPPHQKNPPPPLRETSPPPPPPPPPPPLPPPSQENLDLELILGGLVNEPQIDSVIEEHECNIIRLSGTLIEATIGKLPDSLNQPNLFLEPFRIIKFGSPKSCVILNSLDPCIESVFDFLDFLRKGSFDEIMFNSAATQLIQILFEFLAIRVYIRARAGHARP
ncbi:hypothetical protein ACTFIR_012477 [Dictyostelium discoideum]